MILSCPAIARSIPALLLMGGFAVSAAEEPPRKTVTVGGLGTVMATPNVADIEVGASTQKATAQEALTANAIVINAINKRANENGVKDDDVQTSQFWLIPVYSQAPAPPPGQPPVQSAPRVLGYQVQHIVRITSRDLTKLGPILDALVGAGANQIQGVGLRVDSPDVLKEARKRAMADARSKAEQLALCEGLAVGEPISIRDDSAPSYPVPPIPMASSFMSMAAPAAPPTTISGGEKETRVSVSVVYELIRKAQ